MRVAHPPVITVTGGFLGLGDDRTKHGGIGTGGNRLAEIAALLETAVGNDRNVASGFSQVGLAGSGAVHGSGNLRDTQSEDLTRSTGCAGSDAHQYRGH